MLRKLFVVVAVLALAIPAFSATISRDGSQTATPNTFITNPANGDREDFEFNTAGVIDFVPDTGGSASGWCFYQTHVLFNGTGFDISVTEVAAATNEYTGEFIDLPVEWVFELNSGIGTIADPYVQDWDYRGDFMPSGPLDMFPPQIYDYIDVSGEGIMILAGTNTVWGFENAGVIGQQAGGVMDTYGWWGGVWEPDSNWGRTGVQQVKGNFGQTATEDASFSQVKALY
jgi:hypothetical protein